MKVSMPRLRLGINIDHVATLRNARRRDTYAWPDILMAADVAIKGGADSITVHLREDRRHILDEDVARLRRTLRVPMNLEMAATEAMVKVALNLQPHAVCLVPEKREELTTEGGLDVLAGGAHLAAVIEKLTYSGILVAPFVDPIPEQIEACARMGASAVELHTGTYANATGKAQKQELARLAEAARHAHALGLKVHAGHGLTYDNVGPIAAIPEIVELNIGHHLIGAAVLLGLKEAVKRMKKIMHESWCEA